MEVGQGHVSNVILEKRAFVLVSRANMQQGLEIWSLNHKRSHIKGARLQKF